MIRTIGSRRAALAGLSALLPAALAACESLTTPEQRAERITLQMDLQAPGVDTTNLATGDTLRFIAFVFSEPDQVISLPKSQQWSASDSIFRFVNVDANGRHVFVAARVGEDTLRVRALVNTDAAGDVVLTGLQPRTVKRELFFGNFIPGPPYSFGDGLVVTAPPEQRFNPSSQLRFSANPDVMSVAQVPALVLAFVGDSTLVAVVPAGFATDTARVTDLKPDGRSLLTRRAFARRIGDDDQDALEFNDDSANATVLTTIPDTLLPLSIHGAASLFPDAVDQDRFTFNLEAPATLTFRLVWNVASNLDFEVFWVDAVLGKRLVVVANSQSLSSEQAPATLEARKQYFLRVYPAGPYVGPTTYALLIE